SFSSDAASATFSFTPGQCTLVAMTASTASCSVSYKQSGADVANLGATYNPTDGVHATSSGSTILAVYDATAGFVTGGGWINSPAAACAYSSACASAIGKANFGFVSKYPKGATVPTGETEFQFSAGGFNFHSTVYQWLVISGPMAQYKG